MLSFSRPAPIGRRNHIRIAEVVAVRWIEGFWCSVGAPLLGCVVVEILVALRSRSSYFRPRFVGVVVVVFFFWLMIMVSMGKFRILIESDLVCFRLDR